MEESGGRPAELWQVLEPDGSTVHDRTELSSADLGKKLQGAIVRGRDEGNGWVSLLDEPGYMLIERDGKAILKKGSVPGSEAAEHADADEGAASGEEAGAGAEAEGATAAAAVEEVAMPFACFSCGRGLAAEDLFGTHLYNNVACNSAALQAVVSCLASLPGAGSALWCPACPDRGARWTGHATKAAGLLRHLDAARRSKDREEASAHSSLLRALVGMMLLGDERPPADGDVEELQAWAAASQLLAAAGPLLAVPSAAARRAFRADVKRLLGREVLAGWTDVAVDADQAAAAPSAQTSKAKRRKKDESKAAGAGPSYDFYNDLIPMDVFMGVPDGQQRTADGVVIMDVLSSDEEAPAAAAAAPKPAAAAMPAAVPAAATAAVPAAAAVVDAGQWL